MEIGNVVTALRSGYALRNSATWKVRQNAVNALVGVLSVAVALAKANGYDLPVSDEILVSIAGGVWGFVSVFNGWATTATTAQIGLPSKPGASGGEGAGPVEQPVVPPDRF